jgi:hypothetical protein
MSGNDEIRYSLIAAVYAFLFDTWQRLINLSNMGFVGFWLGVLGRRTLHAIDDRQYRRRALYQSDEHNKHGLFAWEREAIESHFPNSGRLLVIGAGGGREVLALSAMGYEVAGVDCNRTLVELAKRLLREAGSSSTMSWFPRDAAPRDPDPFDGAIVGWGTYMLIIGGQRRIRLLRELAAGLVPGAPVLISFLTWNGSARRLRWIYKLANSIRRVLGREPAEPGDDLGPTFIHLFTPEEVMHELREGGFDVREFREQRPVPHDSGFAVGVRRAPIAPAADTQTEDGEPTRPRLSLRRD